MANAVVGVDSKLNAIAIKVFLSDKGLFLTTMAKAWLAADYDNRRILRLAWMKLIEKYNLGKEAED